MLRRIQKKVRPNFSIKVYQMVLKDRGHVVVEEMQLEKISLHSLPFFRYDPKNIIINHYKLVTLSMDFQRQQSLYDYVFIHVENFDQVAEREKFMDSEEKEKV